MIGRVNTGGGGSLRDTDALLRVIAPAESIVTITKGGTTKIDHGHENAIDPASYDYYFIIHQSQFDSENAWTVTGTLNGYTATDTIIIDAADEYDVVLTYELRLYTAGDQSGWTPIGWSYNGGSAAAYAPSRSYGANSMVISQSGYHSGMTYHAKVDFTRYTSLHLTGSYSGWVTGASGLYIFDNLQSGGYMNNNVAASGISATGSQNKVIDVTNINGEHYVGVATARNDSGTTTFTVTGVWLE